MVEHQGISIGVGKKSHVADPGVKGLSEECDALRFQLRASRLDVLDVKREVGALLGRELHALLLRFPDAEAGITNPEFVFGAVIWPEAKSLHVKTAAAIRIR